ncbi:MAG: hypothetical protein PHV59_00800 [Victivallales bacterium]|nr:hypothetical protein [Victivallales bacterium]
MFPDFGERTVEICHCGKIYIVAKLSVLHYSRVVAVVKNAADAGEAHTQLWAVLQKLLPRQISRSRDLFTYRETVEFCLHLAFGSGLNRKDVEKEPGTKIPEPPELPDYQFEAARIMTQFPAYTPEKLLAEPASIFFALAGYAARISADKALEIIAAGIREACGNPGGLRTKRGNSKQPNPHCKPRDIILTQQREIKSILSERQNRTR